MFRHVEFVLHKHESKGAAKTHYDLRIRYPHKKYLASWALPKAKVPIKAGEKFLAVRTPDHKFDWLKFKGEIPDGEYGAGKISIVQDGMLQINMWTKKMIVFIAEGKPLNGRYALVKTRFKKQNQSSWMFIKTKNQEYDN